MKGFFHATSLATVKAPPSLIPRCEACGLYRGCQSPKMQVAGKGRQGILITGEAPGSTEDQQGLPFVGKTGQKLQAKLRRLGVDLFEDCWVVNSARCRPPSNQLPEKAIEHCRPFLLRDLQELKPERILLLGAAAVKSVIGWLWKEDAGSLERWLGWHIPSQRLNAWVCPAWHPSHVARAQDTPQGELYDLLWEQQLEAALSLRGRPWKVVPDHASKVVCEHVPERAAHVIRRLIGKRPVAFDYETTTLKPDGPHAEIWTCAVSDGRTTVAYPWCGEAVTATSELLRSDTPKIGFNEQFEDRWTRKVLGFWVRNWLHDGMTTAHALDNRPMICSCKFQAFVLLGQEDWSAEVAPYLRSGGANTPNRIKEVPLGKILLYGGLDALLEWKIARKQMRQLEEQDDGR